MNRLIAGFGLLVLTSAAWAQPPASDDKVCFLMLKMSPWIQVDYQTALVEAGTKRYLVTVPNCSSFFTGKTSELVGSSGSRVCEGDEIRYYDQHRYVESCFILDIVRYQFNARTNAVEINEIDD